MSSINNFEDLKIESKLKQARILMLDYGLDEDWTDEKIFAQHPEVTCNWEVL